MRLFLVDRNLHPTFLQTNYSRYITGCEWKYFRYSGTNNKFLEIAHVEIFGNVLRISIKWKNS